MTATSWVENVGQWNPTARYQAQTNLGTLFLAQNAWWWTVIKPSAPPPSENGVNSLFLPETEEYQQLNLRLQFEGSNPNVVLKPFRRLETSVHYFNGNDPGEWYTDVPVWEGVRYENLYPGIDLEISTQQGYTIPRFMVRNPALGGMEQIHISVDGAAQVHLGVDGITVETTLGNYQLPLFEIVDLAGKPIPTPDPILTDSTIIHPFIAPSARNVQNVPTNEGIPSNLIYATYLGGTNYDTAAGIDVDGNGAIYVGGHTYSPDFPTTPGSYDPIPNPGQSIIDAFVSKLSPDGDSLVYSTFIKGNNSDYVRSLKVGADGSAYGAGNTRSYNFPTTPNAPGGFRGSNSAFVLKLNPNGSALAYSVVLGGDIPARGEDASATAFEMALSADGVATIVGSTIATDFPVTEGAYDTFFDPADFGNAFVTRISPNGNTLLFSTFLGGIGNEYGATIDVDNEGNTYIFGQTSSPDFPTTPNAFDQIYDLSSFFVTKINSDGSDLLYSTFLGKGASTYSMLMGVSVGQDGSVYGGGHISGSHGYIPTTPGSYDTECGTQGQGCNPGEREGVAFRLNPAGSDIIYGTYLGGSGNDDVEDIIVDNAGNAYIIGDMTSPEFPYTPGAYRGFYPGMLVLDPTGSTLLYSGATPGLGAIYAFALQAPGVVVMSGNAGEISQFPVTPDAYQPTITGDQDATIARMVLPAIATEQLIPSAGGQLTSTVDQTTYTFGTNTFTNTVLFTHAPRHPLSLPSFAPLVPIGHTFANTAVLSGTTTIVHPQQPYQLNITYTDGEVGSLNENSLKLYRWNGTIWQPEPNAVLDPSANRITANPTDTGWWAVLAPPHQVYLPSVRR